ncbi:MAG: hypothetical protein H6754_06420 [Candidatus Omnitrophica bacterium]|nr:hypothetical protein [Candidatus Omnitrophota bacterium]
MPVFVSWKEIIKNVMTSLGLIFLGLVLTFVFFEGAFRFGGFIYKTIAQQRNNFAFAQKDTTRILCLGESTTEIGGEDSYPRQLERILNSRQNKIKFSVINGGIPGSNTTEIANRLAQSLQTYQPQIVILMMGINDLTPFGKENLQKASLKKNPVVNVLEKSRLVRLFRSLWQAAYLKSHPQTSPPFDQEIPKFKSSDRKFAYGAAKLVAHGRYEEALGLYYELLTHDLDDWPKRWCYRKIADIYLKTKQYENFMLMMTLVLKSNPQDVWASERIESMCRFDKDNTFIVRYLEEAIENNPDVWAYHQLLANCYVARGQDIQADQLFSKIQHLRGIAPNPLTKENYRKVIETLQDNDIQVVIAQYPTRPLGELRNLLEDIDGFDRIIFVDNEKIFKNAITDSSYDKLFIDRFAGDFGHCTVLGNYLLASSIGESLLRKIDLKN